MTRRKHGKLQKLTRKQRVSRAERNERRGRDGAAIRWTKAHVVKEPFKWSKPRPSRRVEAELALAGAIKDAVPGVEDAKRGSK